jgi:hypothetical protein
VGTSQFAYSYLIKQKVRFFAGTSQEILFDDPNDSSTMQEKGYIEPLHHTSWKQFNFT